MALPLLLILNILTMSNILFAQNVIMGTIQFPHNVKKIPAIRVRSGGKIISYNSCEIDQKAKKFTFCAPKFNGQKEFYLLITEIVNFEKIKSSGFEESHNTIDYLKIDPSKPYKLYVLKLETIQSDTADKKKSASHNHTQESVEYHWTIEEQLVPLQTGRIPDDTIVVCFNPTFVAKLEGGSAFELPTIKLKNNLTELYGSEDKFIDLSNKLLLSSLDIDAIHARGQQVVKNEHQRNIIAAPSA